MARNLSQNLKRIVAGLCAVLVVAGTVPANIGGLGLFDTAITASAAEYNNVSAFNSASEADPVLKLNSNVGEIYITRADGTVDLNGHTVTNLFLQNKDPNKTVTVKNGTISNKIDGKTGYDADFAGKVVLENLTVKGNTWADGHTITIISGTYNTIQNSTNNSTSAKSVVNIEGGTFNNLVIGTKGEGYVISGGTFANQPNASWIADTVAFSVTNGSTKSYYGTLSDAVSAWTDNSTLTLLKDVETSSTISVTGTKTLDLNGYGITKTGSGSVISVGSGANFTLTDSNPSQTHKYSIASPQSNGAGLATVDDTNGTTEFTGGYITGGSVTNNNYGGGITITGNSNVTMNGGTVIGNKGTKECGGVQIGQGSKLTMNGGAVIGNSSYDGGAGINARGILIMTGGTVSYNYASNNGCGGGIRTHGPGGNTSYAEISGGYITNNFAASRAGGIGEGKVVLSGSPVIQDNYCNTGKDNIYVLTSDTYFIYINGELTNTTPIGVKLPGGTGVFTRSTNTDYNVAGKFVSDNPDYEVLTDSTSKQLKLGVHDHAFTYTADGDTITAECTGEGTCKITEGLKMTISASDATYDGEAHGATLSDDYNTTAFPDTYTIEYYDGNTKLSGAPVNAGDYTAKVTAGTATAQVDFTIEKAPLTVTADAKSKTYGKDDPALTYTYEGLVSGDSISGELTREAGEDAGTYAIKKGTLSAGDNYELTFRGADLTINKANITITADNKSTKYKSDIAELNYQIGGDYVEGDDLGVTVSTRAAKTSPVGEYDIVVGWNDNPNYAAELKNGKYTITKADLTTSAAGYDGVYDGEAHGITVTLEGENDAVVYYSDTELTANNYTQGSTENPQYTDAGEYTVYYYIATDNYDPQPVSGSKTVNIARAEVTVTANAAGKTYGEDDPELTYEVSGLIGDDTLTGTLTRAAGEDAGSYAIGASRLSAGNNYDITFVGAVFTINKATITVTADDLSKTYGEADPELTYTVTGLKNGDTISGTLTRARGENAGTYAIGMGGLDIGNNYKVNFTAAVFTINKADLTVTANAASKTYGENDPALTYTTEGLLGDDTLTGELAREAGESVGTYAINQGTLSAGNNYNVTFTGADFTISKAALTVTAEAKSKTYGKDDPALTYTAEGLVGADTLTGALTREAGENVGTYVITQGTLKASDNYTLTFTGADFTINKAEITITADDKSTKYKSDLAELTYQIGGDYVEGDDLGVTVSTDATKTSPVGEYDITVDWNKNGNYTATLVNGKYTITKADLTTSATGYDGVYDGKAHSISVDVGDSDAVVYYGTEELTADNYSTAGSTTNPEYTNAGEYTVYYFVSTGNYDPTPVSGSKTVNIAKADVTVTAEAKSKTYGTADPALTYTAEGLVGTETLTGALAREAGENVGTYAINQGTLKASDNYNLTFNGADLTINKAALTVTVEAKSKTYGKDDPELTYTTEGLVGEDTLTGELVREAGENVGTYAITQGTLKASDNYELAFIGDDFTINKAEITITADDKSSQYLDDIAELTYQVGGEYVEGDDLGVTLGTEATNTSDVGEYDIAVDWNGNANYDATLTNGKYTITKAPLEITASGYDAVYDGEAHGITVDVGDSDAVVYYGTEELTAENYETAGSTENPTYTNAGEYTVYFYVVSKNYEADPVTGSKVVNIRKDTPDYEVVVNNEQTYTGEELELVESAEANGGTVVFALGDDAETAPDDEAFSETRPTAKDVGTYYVWYKVIGDENHTDSEPVCLEAAIVEPKAEKTDISVGTVTADTENKTVTVTVDGKTVPASEYHVIYFTYEKTEDGEKLTRVGTEFPTEPGTYIAAVVANEDSETYIGENRSEPFTIAASDSSTPDSSSKSDGSSSSSTSPIANTGGTENPATGAAAAGMGALALAAAAVIVSKKKK